MNGEPRARANLGVDQNFIAIVQQGLIDVFQADPLHVWTQIAGADELGLHGVDGHIVRHRTLGDQHHALGFAGHHIVGHSCGGAGEIGDLQHFGRAFGVGQHFNAGVGLAQFQDIGGREALMHLAATGPSDDLDVGLAGDIAGQEFIGDQDDPVNAPLTRHMFDHLHSIGAGAADIGFGFHVGGGVHIGDNRQTRKTLLDQSHVGPSDRRGEAAASPQIRDQHGFFR